MSLKIRYDKVVLKPLDKLKNGSRIKTAEK